MVSKVKFFGSTNIKPILLAIKKNKLLTVNFLLSYEYVRISQLYL